MGTASHDYHIGLAWTGNTGVGTKDYRSYHRTHEISAPHKPSIPGSSDRAFRGDRDRWNPEELLVVSLSQCHLLWYLDLAARNGIIVLDYIDDATGTMAENTDGSGQFTDVLLRPRVTIAPDSDPELAEKLHTRVHELCFIARSVNFPVRHEPTTTVACRPFVHPTAGA